MLKSIKLLLTAVIVLTGCDTDHDEMTPTPGQSCHEISSSFAGNGLFSVSESKQVRFALGNVIAESYDFANHQYDYGSYLGWDTTSSNTPTSDNTLPTFGSWEKHIAGGWRTLSSDEWKYLLWKRKGYDRLRGAATVCGVHGMVILPDNWQGDSISPTFDGWNTNVYDDTSWTQLENAGAIFLPAAGYYYHAEANYTEISGYYWAPESNGDRTFYIFFFKNGIGNGDYYGKDFGHSVRMVLDVL